MVSIKTDKIDNIMIRVKTLIISEGIMGKTNLETLIVGITKTIIDNKIHQY